MTRTAFAQEAAQSNGRAIAEMASFLTGTWDCAGAFANGRRTAAQIEFNDLLQGAWLSSKHDDVPPGGYHAFSLWGPRETHGIVAYIADAQGGMRRFVANDGWHDGGVLLVRDTVLERGFSERFRYARLTNDHFKMTYEHTRDGGATWLMGDTLSCARRR